MLDHSKRTHFKYIHQLLKAPSNSEVLFSRVYFLQLVQKDIDSKNVLKNTFSKNIVLQYPNLLYLIRK